ncbi:hypothetical protein HX13_07730 [Chryseobacterium sp. P1-3]|uniref:Lipoprotein n=1 Tax=Chryseobacterium gallinarum TaxID=1324352 RepID=A0ABX6KSB9_CHRGL|nr:MULTISPECIES: hypothetical protein [Chryseobacterium]KFF75110.1 hypothetical protein HX13_07730 [Chryseobacterium sp. P1-3]MCL8536501.1 hypothetical protein [Chryseobacterium gallinarum]QIY91377.1 hypothetical protein FOB44_12330 [Chryseobacterium gallinarum]
MNKYILLLLTFCLTTSCVSSDFKSYQSIDNLPKTKEYYEIKESDGKVNYVKVGVHTLYNIQNNHSIYIAFKSKVMTAASIRSSTFGKIDPSPEERVYLKKIDKKKLITDTVYISLPNKVYTFYYKEN